jgi:hypothetical protein
MASRVSRGIALRFLDRGIRREWVVNSTPQPALYPRERPGTHCTGGWVDPRAGLDGRKISPHRDSIPGPSSPWCTNLCLKHLLYNLCLKHLLYKLVSETLTLRLVSETFTVQTCVWNIYCTTCVWNISRSGKNWASYDKQCVLVFVWSTHYSCRSLMKLYFSWQIL